MAAKSKAVDAGAAVASLLLEPNGKGVDAALEGASLLLLPKPKGVEGDPKDALLPLIKLKPLFGVESGAGVFAPTAVFSPEAGGKDELVKRLPGVEGVLLLLAPKPENDWFPKRLFCAGGCAPLPKEPPLNKFEAPLDEGPCDCVPLPNNPPPDDGG